MTATATATRAFPDRLRRFQRLGALAGLAGLVACVPSALLAPERFYLAYLTAYLYWFGIAAACLAVIMLHQLVGGIWGFAIRRPAEAGMMTLPLLAVLFVPLVFGLKTIYPWAVPSIVAADANLQKKTLFLNVDFFVIRAALYFVIWIGMALLLNRGSRLQDRPEASGPPRWMQTVSGPGLALYFLTVSFAMLDWGMTLEPHYFSSIYGVMLLIGQDLAALSLLVIVASWLADVEPLAEVATPEAFHDNGNLMLAFTMLWAYMSVSQYLITWMGNLTEEIPWYLHRSVFGWRWVALALILFHFFVPFFLLLGRDRKRRPPSLARVAWAILVIHLVDQVWLILPSPLGSKLPAAQDYGILQYWALIPAFVGIGGLWVAAFAWQLGRRPLLPRHDPLLDEVIAHHLGGGEHS